MDLFSTKELKQSFFHNIFWQNQFNNLVIGKLKEIVEIQSCTELVILKYSINENNYDFNKHSNTLYNTSYASVTYTINIIRIINIAQKMKFFINFPADLVTFSEDILNGNLYFMCRVRSVTTSIKINILQHPNYRKGLKTLPTDKSCRYCLTTCTGTKAGNTSKYNIREF